VNTYAQLQSGIADWLMREDLGLVLPGFVRLAEAKINRRLRVRQMITRAVSEVECQTLALPDDGLESIRDTDKGEDNEHRLARLPMDEYPARILTTGQPVTYTIVGRDMHFRKVPKEPTPIEVAYYAMVPALSETRTTNWLLQLWPDVYLYGALMHSATYLKDDSRLPVWEAMFETALAEARLSDSLSYNGTRHQIRVE
jgi:hypothetical protein